MIVPMSGFIIAGLVTVLAVLATMARINLRRFLGYANMIDVCFGVIVVLVFEGTYGGIVAAAFAGLFMSISLWLLRSLIGYERLEWKRRGFLKVSTVWVRYPPKWDVLSWMNGDKS